MCPSSVHSGLFSVARLSVSGCQLNSVSAERSRFQPCCGRLMAATSQRPSGDTSKRPSTVPASPRQSMVCPPRVSSCHSSLCPSRCRLASKVLSGNQRTWRKRPLWVTRVQPSDDDHKNRSFSTRPDERETARDNTSLPSVATSISVTPSRPVCSRSCQRPSCHCICTSCWRSSRLLRTSHRLPAEAAVTCRNDGPSRDTGRVSGLEAGSAPAPNRCTSQC